MNTVVPFADDLYHKNRPKLRVGPEEVLKLDDRVGLHPAMKGIKALWDEGQVKVVQGVGYPRPNRSHFRSMEIWQSGALAATPTSGWLGKAADRTEGLGLCHVGAEAPPLAVRGRKAAAPSIASLADSRLIPGASLPMGGGRGPDRDDVSAAIGRRYEAARELSARLAAMKAATPASSPDSIAARLETVRALIEADSPLRVYYTSQGGFDTHSGQKYTHQELLKKTSDAIRSFLVSLRPSRLDERVVVLVFSEFGRRLRENASAGTDHGAAAPVILVGKPVRGGLLGPPPDLSDLEEGDPRFTTDFRDVYATVLRHLFGIESAPILGRCDESLALF